MSSDKKITKEKVTKEKTEKEQYNYAEKIFEEYKAKGCKVLSKHEDVKTTHFVVEYICTCGKVCKKRLHDFKRRGCRNCNSMKAKTDVKLEIREISGEIWKSVEGGMVSSFGNAKSAQGKILSIDNKGRYYINGKHQYVTRLLANAFQIEDYELLKSKKYVVTHIDKNNDNNSLENLKVVLKSDIPRGSKRAENKRIEYEIEEKAIDYKIVPEFPKHKIYSNGQIHNGSRFLKGSVTEGYVNICFPQKTIKLHRLVCYAFHPLPDKKFLDEYINLQVNHINGNTMDNTAKNLEWVTQSQNIHHAYRTGLNKKMQPVLMVYKNGNTREFSSIAEASRATGDTEFQIRSCIKGKKLSTCKNTWIAKDEERLKEYKQKFSVFPQDVLKKGEGEEKDGEDEKNSEDNEDSENESEVLSETGSIETYIEDSDIEQDEEMKTSNLCKFLSKKYKERFELKNNLYVVRGKTRNVRIFSHSDFYDDEEIGLLTEDIPKNSICVFLALGKFKVCGENIELSEKERYNILDVFIQTIFLRKGVETDRCVYKMFYDNDKPDFVKKFREI